MATASPIQQVFSRIVRTGKGSGIALIFLIVGIAGTIISFVCLRDPVYKALNKE